MDLKRSLVSKSLEEVERLFERLTKAREVSVKRAKVADSRAAQTLIEDIDLSIEKVRTEYLSINTLTHPNAVIAALANVQGQETQLLELRQRWADAKKTQKNIDEQIIICEKVLVERNKQKH